MRFPAGLTVRLLRQRVSQAFRSERPRAIVPLSPLVRDFSRTAPSETSSPDTEWHTPKACVRAVEQANAPVVWLGGVEPLFHPAIGDVAAALAESGRYVFLHTSGAGLRQRIHELKPVPRFYLTVEIPLDCGIDSASSREPSANVSFQTVVEALRPARLSGFFLCAHFAVSGGTLAAQVAARLRSLEALGLDGIVVSSGNAFSARPTDPSAADALVRVTRLIPSYGWRRFSRLLQTSCQQGAVAEVPDREPRSTGACEETA